MSELPAEAKNDSLRAAQVIFKRHAENTAPQGSTNASQHSSPFIAESGTTTNTSNNNLSVNNNGRESTHRRNSNTPVDHAGAKSALRNLNTAPGSASNNSAVAVQNSSNNNNNNNSNRPLSPAANVNSPTINVPSPIPIPIATKNKGPSNASSSISRSAIASPTSPSALQTATAAANVVAAKSLSRSLRTQPNQEKLRKGLESAHQAASAAATSNSGSTPNIVTSPGYQTISSPTSPMASSYTEDHSQYFNLRTRYSEDANNEGSTAGGRSSSNTSNSKRLTPKESTTPTNYRQQSPNNIDDIVDALKSIDMKEKMDRSKSVSPAIINGSTNDSKSRKPKRTTSGRIRPPSPAPVLEQPVPNVRREPSPAYSTKSLSVPLDSMANEDHMNSELSNDDQALEYEDDVESFVDNGSLSRGPMSPPPHSDALTPSQIAAMTAASMASGSNMALADDQASISGSMNSYSTMTPYNSGAMSHKNGLPDILPNKRRGNKLRFKIFGKHGKRLNESNTFDSRYSTGNDDSSIARSIDTNQNIKFKTTMRSQKYLGNDNIEDNFNADNIDDDDDDDDDYDSAYEDNDLIPQINHNDDNDFETTNLRESSTNNNSSATMNSNISTNSNSFSNMHKGSNNNINNNSSSTGAMSNLDYSLRDTEDKKKRKRDLIKKTLKTTASAVPYYPHYALTHLVSGVGNVNNLNNNNKSSRQFDEDKPWKSHKDVGFITEPERKRYEAMWVSNRYLYLNLLPWWPKEEVENDIDEAESSVTEATGSAMTGPESEEDEVTKLLLSLPNDGLMLNLVAKDIWERSNLPNDLLKQIYTMVDTRKDGTLNRESFLVGMWLVDQCLYGRKLPQEVDPKVWASVDKWVLNVVNSTMMTALEKKQKKKMMKRELKNIKREQKQAIAEHS